MATVYSGWRVVGINTAVILLLLAGLLFSRGVDAETLASAVRLTARTSVSLFLPVFAASALYTLAPSTLTRWLLSNRRYLGVSFGVSHMLHAAAIASLAISTGGASLPERAALTFIGGGLAYAVILFMVATSFDRTAAMVGRRVWKTVHTTGIWLLWLIFTVSYTPRVVESPGFVLPVSLLYLALILRVLKALRPKGAG